MTSSLEKKAEAAAAIRDEIEQDSIKVEAEASPEAELKTRLRSSTAYDIAASAASYVQSQAKDNEDGVEIEDGEELEDDENAGRIYKSEMAACVAASTMTAVVGAGKKQKEKAAKDLDRKSVV